MNKRIPRSVLYAGGIIVIAALVVTGVVFLLQSRLDSLRDACITTAAKNIYATAQLCEKEKYSGNDVEAAYKVFDTDSNDVGHIFEVHTRGYDSIIVSYVGIDHSGRIIGLYIPKTEETDEIGTKVTDKSFTDLFISKEGELKPIYATATNPDEITVISGATVSSKAVITGVNQAIAAYEKIDGGVTANG